MALLDHSGLLGQWKVDVDIRRYLTAHGMFSSHGSTIVLPHLW